MARLPGLLVLVSFFVILTLQADGFKVRQSLRGPDGQKQSNQSEWKNFMPKISSPAEVPISVGKKDDRHPFDGIGALSAGASSRLLQDYPEAQQRELLDLLFLPRYGASLQVLKVEIGGDAQSTDGSEPSHQRFRDEKPDCTRGYETWLMKEAKKRNPNIKTYGLAWGIPGWIGNGTFFSKDNIDYHVNWLSCINHTYGFEVDYMGIWNEEPWGATWYIWDLDKKIKETGLKTQLVLLDAIRGVDPGFLKEFSSDPKFQDMVAAVGLHYPCEKTEALSEALSKHPSTRFWASEELSTVADWGGAGCWGRMINQNFVRMNATSSIAWSLIWSAYPNLECFGNGLLYAFEPWSGKYEITPPVWATAHTTQFTQVGWQYLPNGLGAGDLPGGGTYVTIASPELDDFTIVFETLEGQCMYHGGCYHHKEASGVQTLKLKLDDTLAKALEARGGKLQVWMTKPTSWFERKTDIIVEPGGLIEVAVPKDGIVTVTTLTGGFKGGKVKTTPEDVETDSFTRDPGFPLPYEESFDDEDKVGRSARFFADQGGAFEVTPGIGPGGWTYVGIDRNKVLEQRVLRKPTAWAGFSPEPFTMVGGVNWTDVSVDVAVKLGMPAKCEEENGCHPPNYYHTGVCARVLRYQFFNNAKHLPDAYCFEIWGDGWWTLMASTDRLASGHLKPEHKDRFLANDGWLSVRLEARSARLKAFIDGEEVASLLDASFPVGQVALVCGYHACQYDNLAVKELDASSAENDGMRSIFKRVDPIINNWHARSCDVSQHLPKKRNDFSGFVGSMFKSKTDVLLKSLGRLALPIGDDFKGHAFARIHNLSIWSCSGCDAAQSANKTFNFFALDSIHDNIKQVASVIVPTVITGQVGIEESEDGFIYADLLKPVTLKADMPYIIMSSELTNEDYFYDKYLRAEGSEGIITLGSAYSQNGGLYVSPSEGSLGLTFGPLNARLLDDSKPTESEVVKVDESKKSHIVVEITKIKEWGYAEFH
eukprot:TRINITY_DN2394_c1_g4_i1.p1 TRINITY_DN2394_c1_g4~~TRINITY_DN2394_c1_g4_i1.p1  ORF type:complete len:991 (-),score=183.30 TRINITY_DN2394_c1_g4_i1:200-3172(-)